MAKIHRLLEWLTVSHALDYLSDLVGERVTFAQLLSMRDEGRIGAYLRVYQHGTGVRPDTGKGCDVWPSLELGPHLICMGIPEAWEPNDAIPAFLMGKVAWLTPELGLMRVPDIGPDELQVWNVTLKGDEFKPIFKRSEIEALADQINGVEVPSSAAVRKQRAGFVSSNRNQKGARDPEYKRWRARAAEIQGSRSSQLSKHQLAAQVKDALSLPDSVETIRKRL